MTGRPVLTAFGFLLLGACSSDSGSGPADGGDGGEAPTCDIAALQKEVPFPDCDLPAGLEPIVGNFSSGNNYMFDPDNLLLYEIAMSDAEWRVACENARDHAHAEWKGGDLEDNFVDTWAKARLRVDDEGLDCVGWRMRGDIHIERLFFQDDTDEDPEPEFQDCLNFEFAFKPSFKIGTRYFIRGQEFHEQQHISIGGQEGGNSQMRDYLIAQLAESFGVPSPRVNHGLLCINGVYRGVITIQEEHDDQPFLDYHFPDEEDGSYYKVHDNGPMSFYEGGDMDRYRTDSYEPVAGTSEDDAGAIVPFTAETDIVELLNFSNFTEPDDFAAEIDTRFQADAWLKLMAIETVMADIDGMFGAKHNYLLYNHPTDGWWPVRNDWDGSFSLNRLFDPGTEMTKDRLYGLRPDFNDEEADLCDGRAQIDEPLDDDCPGGCAERNVRHPVIAARLIYARRAEYLAHVQGFLDTVLDVAAYQAEVDERRALLEPYYQDDPWVDAGDWSSDVDEIRTQLQDLYDGATAALADALANPPAAADASLEAEMMEACGDTSCWPYACP